MSISCIDLSNYASAQDLGEAIEEELANIGFLAFVNHGLEKQVDRMFTISQTVFQNLTDEEKSRFARKSQLNGYVPISGESLDPTEIYGDAKEAYNIPCAGSSKEIGVLPGILDEHREEIWNFELGCHNLSQRLLESFAASLGIPHDTFTQGHSLSGDTLDSLRFLHYMPVHDAKNAVTQIRGGAHTDYGSLTLLFQEREGWDGLQVLINDEWINVTVPKGAVIVNVADALEFWSSGKLRSTTHRIVLSDKDAVPERYTIAFFNQPLPYVRLNPVVHLDKQGSALKDHVERKGISMSENLTSYEYLKMRIHSIDKSKS